MNSCLFFILLTNFFKVLRDQALSDYFIVYLRLMVSNYLQQNAEFFSAFIEGETSMKDFCSHVSEYFIALYYYESSPRGFETPHFV